MLNYAETSGLLQGIILLLMIIPIFGNIYVLIWEIILKRRKVEAFLLGGITIAEYLIFQMFYSLKLTKENVRNDFAVLGEVKLWIIFAFIIGFIGLTVYAMNKVNKIRHSTISEDSIKECLDNLSTGVCVSDKNGLPLLVNNQMHSLCQEYNGERLLDANVFWRSLSATTDEEGIRAVKLSNGTVWNFIRRPLVTKNAALFQIFAYDVTAKYSFNQELKNNISQLKEMNKRMKDYSDMVGETIKDEEIAAAKVAVHNQLCNALIVSGRFITAGEELMKEDELLRLWKFNIELLKNETKE